MATLTGRLRRSLLASLLVAAAGFGGCFATPERSTAQWASAGLMIFALIVALGLVIALPAARALQATGNRRLPQLALALTVLATVIAAGLALAHSFGLSDDPIWETVRRFAFPFGMAAIIASMLSGVSTSLDAQFRWLRSVALGGGFAFVTLLFTMVAIDTGNRMLFTILGALLAAALAARVTIAVIHRRARRQSSVA